MYILDILIQLNTAYFKNGILTTDRNKIFRRYLKVKFLKDIIIFSPYFVAKLLFNYDSSILESLLLLRI